MMDSGAERRTHNVRLAESLDDRAWATILLTAFRENRLPSFQVPLEATPLTEVSALFGRVNESARAIMKTGVARALAEYKRSVHGHEVLRGLAWTASAVRATDAVADLVAQVISLSQEIARDDTPEFRVAGDLLSVLAVLSPHTRVEFLFRNLLFDDNVHFRFAGTLAIGLVKCDPTKFVVALNQFVERRAKGPRFFNDRSLMGGLFEAIPRTEVEASISSLSALARPFVIEWADRLDVLKAYAAFPPDSDFIDADTPRHLPPIQDFRALNDMYSRAATGSNLSDLYSVIEH